MARPVMITADTTCDMSPELLERFRVATIPLTIVEGERQFKDGKDITADDIFEIYRARGVLPTTAAVTPAEYLAFFGSFVERGMSVVHLNLSSALSSTHNNACLAAKHLGNVTAVDTLSLCTGMALLICKACDMRDAGLEAEEIGERLETLRPLVHTSFVINTLEFLVKGGRCSALTAAGATLLGIKPSIEMRDGMLREGKRYRGKLQSVFEQYARDKLTSCPDIDPSRIFLSHSGLGEEQISGILNVIRSCGDFGEIFVTRAGCTISSHCGPDTMAVMFMSEPNE
ncbi:MAG TPA: DegV family protein [Oscillospiraceae bacterium]|nr:DegV family protein [Oscillospiraceae bacterium]